MGKIVIEAPKHPVVRYRIVDERTIQLDLRGIRNPHSPFNGRLNPSKGNKKRWVSPSHLECMVNEYFESCNGPLFDSKGNLVYDKAGNIVKGQVKPFTVSGLALYLGVKTDTMRRYTVGKIDSFLDEMHVDYDPERTKTYAGIILAARQKIEEHAEARLFDRDGQRGAQFVLDNVFNWTGRREQAEIEKIKADMELKKKEFELKRKLLDEGNEDGTLTINIVRGKKDASD